MLAPAPAPASISSTITLVMAEPVGLSTTNLTVAEYKSKMDFSPFSGFIPERWKL